MGTNCFNLLVPKSSVDLNDLSQLFMIKSDKNLRCAFDPKAWATENKLELVASSLFTTEYE